MRNIKVILGAVIAGVFALIIIQNKGYFFNKVGFRIDLYFRKYQTPEVHNLMLFLAVFLFGLLLAYIFSLLGQYKSKKTLKNLNMTLKSQMEVISELRSEIEAKDSKIKEFSAQNKDFRHPVEVKAEGDSLNDPADSPETGENVINKEENNFS